MKIIIDGVEYIATPVGEKSMKDGVRAISRRYNDCPEFFDALLNKGFAYYEHDGDAGYDVWTTHDGTVFTAFEKDILSEWKDEDHNFLESQYPSINGWNIPEFQERLEKTNSVFRMDALSATTSLLQYGAAYTYAQLDRTKQLTPLKEKKYHVTIN